MNRTGFNPLVATFLKGKKAVALTLVLCGLVSNCLTIFLSLSIGTYYETLGDHLSTKGRILHVFHIALPHNRNAFFLVFLVLVLTAAALQFLFRFGSQRAALHFSFWLRQKLFRHQVRMKMEVFLKKSMGSYLLRYSGDLRSAQSYLEKGIFQFGSDLFFVALGIWVLFRLHVEASMYVASGFIAGFSLMRFLSLKIEKLNKHRTDLFASNLSYIHEQLHSLETIKTWNKEYQVIDRFKKQTTLLRHESTRTAFWKSLHHILPFALMFLLLLIVFLTHTAAENGVSFIPYILLLLLLFPAIKRTMRVTVTWKSGIAGLQKISSILLQPLENEHEPIEFKFQEGRVEFHQVSFSYDSGKQVINEFSCIWERGRINYLDGKGKTTILKLLAGLYLPSKGNILLDGQDLRKISLKSLRQQIAFCTDHTPLLGNTLFKCLFLDKSHAAETVRHCLHLLQFSTANDQNEFNVRLRIGKGGRLLSQSDVRKLKIARTLLSKKKIWVFDSIIGQLEPAVQQELMTYLDRIKKEKTVILTTKSWELSKFSELQKQEVTMMHRLTR